MIAKKVNSADFLRSRHLEPPPRQGGGKVKDVDGMIAKLKELGAL